MDQAEIRRLLDYDPGTGLFTWRVNRPPRGRAGAIAGYDNGSSYIKIGLGGFSLYAHQAAFLWMTGEIPAEIDHRDRNRSNNRWENLRAATRAINLANIGDHRGVRPRDGRWEARYGRRGYIGRFDTEDDAKAAYTAAARAAGRL